MRKVLLVEDDPEQAQRVEKAIKVCFKDVSVQRIRTEADFYQFADEIAADALPDLVILDVMLPWASAVPDFPAPPEEVKRDGFFRAGLRCQRFLADNAKTRKIPVVLYSILEAKDLRDDLDVIPEECRPLHLQKHHDVTPLLAAIRSIFTRR